MEGKEFDEVEDKDFSETGKFIRQILMEDNFDESPLYDSLSLQITQKSFLDALTANVDTETTKTKTKNPSITAQQLKTRKNREGGEEDDEGRRSEKQSALSIVDESDLSDAIDCVFVSSEQNLSGAVKAGGRGGHGGSKKQVVDLRNLVLMCSQCVHGNDNRTANELLKQIRQYSSPFGDASQRIAHYFANALEARLVGAGSGSIGIFSFLTSQRITAAHFLKAYQLFLSATPFKKFTYFFANQMIFKASSNAQTIHILDFGILYGFQWPILIKLLSNREGGPPKLRITGIEFPHPGFRPTHQIHQTCSRLANYCKRYNVPFQYNAIASRNWETIPLQDFQIESNEIVAVNCHMRFEHLLDECTVEVNSPRNAFLHLIRKINPDIFTQIIVNASYNVPFFATRFREALFHYSAIYDMFDTVIPCDNEWRMTIEKEILGREVMNVIACEGPDRVQRPETYKQWHIRNTRAGFKQLPLNEELMAKFRTKLKEWYHRDFVLDEDNNWMLQGAVMKIVQSFAPSYLVKLWHDFSSRAETLELQNLQLSSEQGKSRLRRWGTWEETSLGLQERAEITDLAWVKCVFYSLLNGLTLEPRVGLVPDWRKLPIRL
ncbi:hypothetical protein VNO78_05515 [Psophocarpus tetragonolobus]|uniref:Scarecrow-like protein 14 n=1 Tax=Psophocarpus tetragonolobus TaxID=3891 RepID=A0AAN9SQX7_PSOTE